MDVELSQADAVYAHYLTHQQNRARARMMYGLLAARIRPMVTYRSRERLRRLVRSGAPVLIAANHVSEKDPLVLAAAGFRSPLRSRIGHLRVLAKDELFEDPEQRRKIDTLGGIPVFRTKDHGVRAAAEAGRQMIGVCVDRMAAGDSIAVFPEGTCNEGDPTQLQKLGTGIGHIGNRALRRGVGVWLVSAGIAYPDAGPRARPVVVLGEPLDLAPFREETPAALTRSIQRDLQGVVDDAWKFSLRG
ncbi:1-acyl-sn-glycerol-3-phosphate acyltransferase [Gordonia sp. zg691]|uniref:lysophospholipid acyltransferase family protein n=1 Tax=Gordonia jinghuaiqii TaxID=2758710 RepID=UPI0016625F12|nr:1-acyl-sn-glycerol-3-phosphate acyltransferase [Gordonia jinghuaiqii]MBD0862576.1 1-acyl-sn-glycerol-3-phosphate acyltransferase [Gordonia jinghuaiqii]